MTHSCWERWNPVQQARDYCPTPYHWKDWLQGLNLCPLRSHLCLKVLDHAIMVEMFIESKESTCKELPVVNKEFNRLHCFNICHGHLLKTFVIIIPHFNLHCKTPIDKQLLFLLSRQMYQLTRTHFLLSYYWSKNRIDFTVITNALGRDHATV